MHHWQVFFPLICFFGLGVVVHFAERRWPLRVYETPKAWRVDTLGFVLSSLVTDLFRLAQPHTISRLPAISGFGWTGTVANLFLLKLSWPIRFLISVVVLDLLLYVGHRLLHSRHLWHTHAVHHSVEHLYWFGGNRSSPFHVAFQLSWGAFLGLLLPVYGGVAAFVAATVLYTAIQHFNHANLNLRLGPLEWLFVIPRYHFVHHSSDPRLNNSNFGFLFTVWDRMFGTYTDPDRVPRDNRLGLNYEADLTRLFIGLPPAAVNPVRTTKQVAQ